MLERKTASCVILHMKSIFASDGIPSQLVSDNMPFASRKFNEFAKEWGIQLTTSSPMYPQSNGQSERAVQTMKNMLKRSNDEGRDPYLALESTGIPQHSRRWNVVLTSADADEP